MNEPAKTVESQPLPTTPEMLLEKLQSLDIVYELHHHAPIFTVEEGAPLEKEIPGVHCRNLFLRDKKEKMFLLVAANETEIDLKKLPTLLDCGRLSFGSKERLWQYLGIRPGSVCPFCILNDKDKAVEIILDKAMMGVERVNYHPLDNAMTIGLSPADLLKFIESTGHTSRIIDLSPAAPNY